MKFKIILLLALFTLALGCNKENDITTIEKDQIVSTSLKSHETTFEGTSSPYLPMDPGIFTPLSNDKFLITGNIAEWYELSGEPMVTGQSIWYVNWLIEADWSGAEVWGTTEIYVGLESGGDIADADGKWELIWHGWLTDGAFDSGSGFFGEGMIEVEAVGTGVSGVVEGMIAQWTYTLDLSTGLVYNFVGSINSKPVTKTIKFQRAWGTFEIVDEDPYYQTLIIGEGNATLIGHFTNKNTYDSDEFATPIGGPWLGFNTAANGDEIYTQMIGFNPAEGSYEYVIIGGTGRFEGATGTIFMWGTTDFATGTWEMQGEGEITY